MEEWQNTLDKLTTTIINNLTCKSSREIENSVSQKINICFYLAIHLVLNPYIIVELAKNGYKGSLYYAPFNQFEQEFEPDSGLYSFDPDVV